VSDFKILHPYIANYSASSVSGFASAAGAGYGSRKARLENGSASTSSYLQINHTTATAVDFVYIANLDLSCRLIDPTDLTVTIKGSTVSNFATSEDLTYSVGLADLIGRYGRDWVQGITFTQSYQYYRVQISSASSKTWAVGKIWLGSALDLGSPDIKLKTDQGRRQAGHRENIRQHKITFKGITPTQQNAFFQTIEKYNLFGDLVLWDIDDAVFDNSETVLYCRMMDAKSDIKAGGQNYTMDLNFREVY
jgi:hypothetical protein